ncbi:MAG: diguanylate cyclase [Neptuniibacter sp.]
MKKLLNLLITLSVLGLGCTLSASLYWMAESEFQKHIKEQAENVHFQVQQRFRVFDELLSSDEKQVQEHARRALIRMSDVLMHEKFDPKDWSPERLDKLAKQLGVDSVYVINSETAVVATNFIPDLGFKLDTISDSFKDYLHNLFNSGRLEVDRINVSSKTGIIKIYAYYAPVNSDYILEVSYDVKNYLSRNRSSRYVDFMFGDFFTEMTKTNPLLDQVDIYLVNNYAAFPFLHTTPGLSLSELPEIPEHGIMTVNKDKDIIHYYSRADFNRTELHSADYLAIRSTFNLEYMYHLMNKFVILSLIVIATILIIAYLLISQLFNKWIMSRIFRIIAALERSADGDYRDILDSDRMDELGLIAQHVNSMNSRLAARDKEIKESRLQLEYRVKERTSDLQLEIEARKVAEEKLIKQAETDPLTGILNRRAFAARANKEIERAKRYNRPISAILLDLDHFKQVNDKFGHQCGDKVLVELAEIISPCLRTIDCLSRHGGEEFLILLPETDELEASQIAERLRKRIEDHDIHYETEIFRVTSSFGVASWDKEEHEIHPTIHRADQALYMAKHKGRNQVISYSTESFI